MTLQLPAALQRSVVIKAKREGRSQAEVVRPYGRARVPSPIICTGIGRHA